MRSLPVQLLRETSVRMIQCHRHHHIFLFFLYFLSVFLLSFFPSFRGNVFFSRCLLFRAPVVETQAGQTLDPVTLDCSSRQVFPAAQCGGPIHCVFEKLCTVCLSCYCLCVVWCWPCTHVCWVWRRRAVKAAANITLTLGHCQLEAVEQRSEMVHMMSSHL